MTAGWDIAQQGYVAVQRVVGISPHRPSVTLQLKILKY